MKNNKKIKRILLAGLFVTVLGASFAVYNSKNSAFAGGKMIKFHGMKMSKDAIKGKDIMTLSAQKWLNEQYKDVDGYGEVEETGKVSEDTINGLIRGLQVELGITELANNFGPSTSQKFSEQFNELSKESEQSNAVKILQFALYCKGYRTNKEVKGKFGNGTERAVKQLQHNIGLEETGKVDVKLFRDAILSTKSFLLSNGKAKNKGDDKVREIQKAINNKCYPYEKFKLLRCDGIRDGDTAKGLIFLIQAEENMALEDANGNFGPGTTSSFPELSKGSDKENFVKILQYSLYWYGYNKSGRFDGKFDNKLANEVSEYQKFMCLPKDDGVVDVGTMKSLLLSCGDNERKTDACDTAKPLEEKDVKKLKEEGYKYVGRYLKNADVERPLDKEMTASEVKIIHDAGLSIFPIFQTSGNYTDYFTEKQGNEDAINAVVRAKNLSFPYGSTLYFAVDYDIKDDEIDSNVIPYFKAINERFKALDGKYKIGVYGPRSVCTKLASKGLVKTSFVADASRLYTGNLGIKMPSEWAFEQIITGIDLSGENEATESEEESEQGPKKIKNLTIDNVVVSGRDEGVSKVDLTVPQADFATTAKEAGYEP